MVASLSQLRDALEGIETEPLDQDVLDELDELMAPDAEATRRGAT